MNSILREKYSISSWFYLFSSFLFLLSPLQSQEVVWSDPGIGPQPEVTIFGEDGKLQSVLVSSPFASKLRALNVADGKEVWSRELLERTSYPPIALDDGLLVQGDQGTVWALGNADGEPLWQLLPKDPLDYPVGPPRYRDGAVFTVSRRGVVRKVERTGRLAASAQRDDGWDGRRAETVEFRSNQKELSYLDQSGRLTTYDPATLALLFTTRVVPPGERGDVVAGALMQTGETSWTVEMPGVVRAVDTAGGEQLWRRPMAGPLSLWSEDGKLLSIPSPMTNDEAISLLVLEAQKAVVYQGQSGQILSALKLPSPATAPPVYDRETRRRWFLCHNHLINLSADLQWQIFELPIVDKPISLDVRGNWAAIGTAEGRVYALRLPLADET